MMAAFNIGLAVLVLALAVWTVVARDTFTAVVGFVAYGLLLALVWVQLHGVDVALTEAALGSGLTGALLLGAATRLRKTERPARSERPGLADAPGRRSVRGQRHRGARHSRAHAARSGPHAGA